MAEIVQGWLMVPYKGHDLAQVAIGLDVPGSGVLWYNAFLDYHDGNRIAKIKAPDGIPPKSRVGVLLRISGRIVQMGSVTLP